MVSRPREELSQLRPDALHWTTHVYGRHGWARYPSRGCVIGPQCTCIALLAADLGALHLGVAAGGLIGTAPHASIESVKIFGSIDADLLREERLAATASRLAMAICDIADDHGAKHGDER